MDLNEITVFIRVVQTGSFSQAAKLLGMPNSTVSHRVSSLEKRLGVTLLQRTTRKLHVTPMGEAYFKKCVQGLEAMEVAEQEVVSSQKEPQGLLRITAPIELGSTVLPGIVSEFTKKFPKVRVESLLTDRRVDLLGEGVDLAIRAGVLKDSTLIAKKIGVAYLAPFASPKYLKARGEPSHPKELIHHDCLLFPPIGLEQWLLSNGRSEVKAFIKGKIITNDMRMIKTLVLLGEGIALLPTHYCYPEVGAGKLVRILADWHSNSSPVQFVYPAQKFVTPKISAFMELASPTLKQSFELFEI